MNATVFTPLKTGFAWVDATTNVDGTPITAGEVTGFTIGVRTDGDATHGPGNYEKTVAVTGATATAEAAAAFLAALSLAPGNYWAAIQSTGPVASAWSTEAPFAIPAPLPVPNAPSGFSAS